MERLRYYYRDEGFSTDVFESVLVINTSKPLDFHYRMVAVAEFRKLIEAKSLAAANKRTSNLLKKSGEIDSVKIKDNLLVEEAEINLANTLKNYKKIIAPMIKNRNYKSALSKLAELRKVVDDFFDNVMVLCDEPELKKNRLTLLSNLNSLFLEIADISKLQD
jgi:glycyl-tRNA synthetase beta chain